MRKKPSSRKRKNELKLIILGVLENRGWKTESFIRYMSDSAWPLSGYLNRILLKWKLVERMGWHTRPIYWRLTTKGRERLAWLRRTMS